MLERVLKLQRTSLWSCVHDVIFKGRITSLLQDQVGKTLYEVGAFQNGTPGGGTDSDTFRRG